MKVGKAKGCSSWHTCMYWLGHQVVLIGTLLTRCKPSFALGTALTNRVNCPNVCAPVTRIQSPLSLSLSLSLSPPISPSPHSLPLSLHPSPILHTVVSTQASPAPECQWGPSYWCQSKETAVECGQEAYCSKQAWKVS